MFYVLELLFEVTADSAVAPSPFAAECAVAVEVDLFHSGVRLTRRLAYSVTAAVAEGFRVF